jgi:L,D-peptidoglycan transpeptidase YkuD (ErfK/YbiS/YcfS/YnhG family)
MSEAIVHPDGRLELHGRFWRCALGRGGPRVLKQEGDGATPAGLLALRRVLYRADRVAIPRAEVPREPIGEQDAWCDDPGHADYNRQVRLPHPGRHEELWRRDGLYDVVGVLGWNDAPVERDRGSAIFLHVARADYAPTEGCVALARADLLAVLQAGVTALLVLAPMGRG